MDNDVKTYAGFWLRVKAFTFDYLIISLYLIFVLLLFLTLNSIIQIDQVLFTNRVSAQAVAFLIVTLPITLYFAIGESSTKQAAWGKQRLNLKVTDHEGKRIKFWRALARTVLKFIPWELSHTLIWNIYFSTESFPTYINYGFALVYLLIGLNIVSVAMTKTKQSLYDLLAGTFVIVRGSDEIPLHQS
jgi:uncharacterized RDD family membrane protein YckC